MAHEHVHNYGGATAGRRMGLSVVLTLLFVAGEAVAGWFANSLALLSDAGHNFADALALGLSWYALRLARRPGDARRTYGFHRVGILTALVNAVSLVVLALLIFYEAVERFRHPGPVHGWPMIGVALAAVILNGVISFWLHHEAKHDLNVRSAYLHMLGDALSALGVVAAGLVVLLTGQTVADPAVSVLIGCLILWSSWSILAESVNILLEAAPAGLDMAALERGLRETPGVQGMHDLHVWTVASGIIACSCHIIVAEKQIREGQQIVRSVADLLRHRFGVTHTTIQVEIEGCNPDDLFCTLHRAQPPHSRPHNPAEEHRSAPDCG